MLVEQTALPGVLVLYPKRHGDHRGFFSETYSETVWREAGVVESFVQDNQSLSATKGTVRGLHFQAPPFAQAKLLRVTRGRIQDCVVDIRKGSPTYGKGVAVEISAEAWNQIFVPAGFAHGFCTLEADTEVLYKASALYSPAHDGGILWNDPALALPWQVTAAEATLSDKDGKLPRLADFESPFTFA